MALRAAIGARKWRPSVVVFFQQLGVGIRVEPVVELVGLVDIDDEQPASAEGILIDRLGLVRQPAVEPGPGPRHPRVPVLRGIARPATDASRAVLPPVVYSRDRPSTGAGTMFTA